jgi:hypothetical protein
LRPAGGQCWQHRNRLRAIAAGPLSPGLRAVNSAEVPRFFKVILWWFDLWCVFPCIFQCFWNMLKPVTVGWCLLVIIWIYRGFNSTPGMLPWAVESGGTIYGADDHYYTIRPEPT